MIQKVAEIVYQKVEDRTAKSSALTMKIVDLFPEKEFDTMQVIEIISEYGRKGTGLEEAATKILTLIDSTLIDVVLIEETTREEDSDKPVLVPGSEDEKLYIANTFSSPELVVRLVAYLRSKNETVNVIDIEDDTYGEYIVNGVTYNIMNKDEAYEQAVENRAESICANAYDMAYDDIHHNGEELCWYLGYNCDEHEDEDVIIFRN